MAEAGPYHRKVLLSFLESTGIDTIVTGLYYNNVESQKLTLSLAECLNCTHSSPEALPLDMWDMLALTGGDRTGCSSKTAQRAWRRGEIKSSLSHRHLYFPVFEETYSKQDDLPREFLRP